MSRINPSRPRPHEYGAPVDGRCVPTSVECPSLIGIRTRDAIIRFSAWTVRTAAALELPRVQLAGERISHSRILLLCFIAARRSLSAVKVDRNSTDKTEYGPPLHPPEVRDAALFWAKGIRLGFRPPTHLEGTVRRTVDVVHDSLERPRPDHRRSAHRRAVIQLDRRSATHAGACGSNAPGTAS